MSATTATSRALDRSKVIRDRPRIGLVGIMQELYDEMLPGISRAPGGIRRRGRRRARRGRRRSRCGARQEPARGGGRGPRARAGRGRRPPRRDADVRSGDAGGAGARRHAAPGLSRQRAAGSCDHPRLGHERPDLQPGDSRCPGHGQRDGACPSAVSRRYRRLEGAFVRERGRPVGARRGCSHPLATTQGRDPRLRDERHGRHSRRRSHAAPHARPADRLDRPRRPGSGGRGGRGRMPSRRCWRRKTISSRSTRA